ncbi:MAG: hypothetical protein JO113_06720, partial [Candidatus Eremiobacteraeota bacterium]|nr:hypothetical protein [Candidatus Eremiobacteraeota bacterium]
TMLQPSVSAAPLFAVESAHVANGTQLVFVTHASDGLLLKHLAVTPPSGQTASQKLNAMMRLGYQYVERANGTPWPSGAYGVAYTGLDRANRSIVYRGTVQVA